MDSDVAPAPPQLGRPVTGTEYSWCRAVPGGTGVTVVALLLSRPISIPQLQSAIRRLQLAHPILRSHLTTAGAVTANGVNSDRPFFSVPLSPPSSSLRSASAADILQSPPAALSVSPFHALLEHELNQNPWSQPAGPVPVFFATVYELPEQAGWSVLALRFHTAVCDQTSAVAVLQELMGLMFRPPEPEDGKEEDKKGEEAILLPGIEDLIPAADARKPFWARSKDLLGYSLNGLWGSTLLFEDAGSDRSTEMVRLVMTVEETEKLLNECKAKGIKLCGVMSAAAIIAAYSSKKFENGQHEAYGITTLMNCRRYLDPIMDDRAIGFYHSAILNTLVVHGAEGLWEVALRCHNACSSAINNKKHLKDIGDVNFLMCKAIENPHLTPSSSLRTGLVSVFEEPVIYESCDIQRELGLEDYLGCSSVHGVGPSIAVFATIRDGQLDCACVYPSPLHSRKQMLELVEHMSPDSKITGSSNTDMIPVLMEGDGERWGCSMTLHINKETELTHVSEMHRTEMFPVVDSNGTGSSTNLDLVEYC